MTDRPGGDATGGAPDDAPPPPRAARPHDATPPSGRADPVDIRPSDDGARLRIAWRDGHISEFEPRLLRVNCRCAGCIDEFTGRPLLDPARVPADVHPLAIRRVGRYALQFDWSDGHNTGLYPFDLLRDLCRCGVCLGGD